MLLTKKRNKYRFLLGKMGQSLPTPDCEPSVCPLCHSICRNPTALRCKHIFCYCCIQELWSGSPTGPYYCPECKEEYKTLPVGFKRDTTASPWRHDAPAHTRTTAATGNFPNSPDTSAHAQLGWGQRFRGLFITPLLLQNVPSVTKRFTTQTVYFKRKNPLQREFNIGPILIGPSTLRSVCSVWFINGERFPVPRRNKYIPGWLAD